MKYVYSFFLSLVSYIVFSQDATTATGVVSFTGTGQTTGHIANLLLQNNGDEPLNVMPQVFYIASDGKHQEYIGHIPEGTTVPPGSTVTIPIDGFCADVTKPPVSPEGPIDPASIIPVDVPDWLGNAIPSISSAPGEGKPFTVFNTNPQPPFTPTSIPEITSSSNFIPAKEKDPVIQITWPGTDTPVGSVFKPNATPESIAPVLTVALNEIAAGYDRIREKNINLTPFSPDPVRERDAVIQHTFWIYTAILNDEEYSKQDFTKKVYDQFRYVNDKSVDALPESERLVIDSGISEFWIVFQGTGLEAKVFADHEPGEEVKELLLPENKRLTPGTTAAKERRCLRFGQDPQIDPRTGFDLFGDLYRKRMLPSDYLDDVRHGRLARKIDNLRAMQHSLRTVLGNQFNQIPCDEKTAHKEAPQSFPEFPWDDFFLTVDFCADNDGKTKLSDFIDPNADPDALKQWLQKYESSIDNLGLYNTGSVSYAAGFQNTIDRAMSGIGSAYQTFQDDMHAAMALRFNRSRAEAKFWSAMTTIVAAAVSAGIAAGASGAIGALASAFISGTGFVWEEGLEALGADPAMASLIGSLITLSMGVASAWGPGLIDNIGEEIISGMPGDFIEIGADATTQEEVMGFVMAMAMLDDNTWNAFIKELSKDYNQDAIDRFNEIRNEMRAEVERHVKSLCEVLNSLNALLPALLEAQDNAERWLHSAYWKDLWKKAMDSSLDCCCEWSDGSPRSGACTVTIPEFGHSGK